MNTNPATPVSPDNLTQQANNFLKSTEVAPEYPNVFPINLAGGRIYIDSTPNKENVYIRHKSGSFIYFEPNGDIFVHSPRDIKVCAERNLALKVGEGNKDACMIQVTGDAKIKVENDLTLEVGGNKNETITGNYNLTVKGSFNTAANTRNCKTTGTHTENTHEKVNNVTFVKNNIGVPDKEGVGGEIRDIIFGNRVFELVDPRSTFSIISAGNINFNATLNMTQSSGTYTGFTGGYFQEVTGPMDFQVGGLVNFKVTGVFNINSGGLFSVVAPQIFLN
jgi:hypothetical protein